MSHSLQEPSVLTQGSCVNLALSSGLWARQLLYSLLSLSFRPTCHRDDTVLSEVGICHAVDILVLGTVAFDEHFTIN